MANEKKIKTRGLKYVQKYFFRRNIMYRRTILPEIETMRLVQMEAVEACKLTSGCFRWEVRIEK